VEYLVVYFDEDRGVIVNDAPGDWMTNQPFMLQAGSYTIELAPPPNYKPLSIQITLINTTELQPYEITFTRNPSSSRRRATS